MKIAVLYFTILITQAAFALTGVIESKVAGEKEVSLEFAAVKAMASAITADVHVDHDSQDMTCNLYVRFPSFAQAVFTIDGIKVQENLNVIVYLSSERINSSEECVVVAAPAKKSVAVYLERAFNPGITISQRYVNDVLHKTVLVLDGPSNIISADLSKVGASHYTLSNVKLPTEVILNFAVAETGPGSISYLEHGQVTVK